MPGSSSNNSFIPKRGPALGAKRKAVSRQVYVFTIISYVLLFAALLATGGVFLYENYLIGQRDEAIQLLHDDITSFSRADMEELQRFDKYLAQAYNRLDKTVAMSSIFTAIEAATIDTVRLDSLEFERVDDDSYTLTAAVKTDSFDSTISQRKVYNNNSVVESIIVSAVRAASGKITDAEGQSANLTDDDARLSFDIELSVPLSAIPYVPGAPATTFTMPETAPVSNTLQIQSEPVGIETSSDEVEVNETAI